MAERRWNRILAGLCLASGLACGGADETSRPPPLARLGDRAFGPADVVLGRTRPDEAREDVLERAIRRALAAEEARRRGLADAPEVQARLALVRARARREEDRILGQLLFEAEREAARPSEEALRAHYQRTKSRYLVPMIRLRRVSHSSREEAEAALAALGPGERLDPEAAETLGPLEIQRLPGQVLPEAVHLEEPGDRAVSGSDEEGWAVIELVERLPAEPRPFETLRERLAHEVRTGMALDAVSARVAALRDESDPRIDDAALAAEEPFRALEEALAEPDATGPRSRTHRRP